ncbi:hypothetical protein K458DRAFT_297696 [Lentithecium fluviatile CBS 122367]|uniref:tRNA(Ile)-lysidine synthetase n=1 Tax=Lentithecium fluviatile CBS 122367 TaxID=1168545 RepID=A0A6G1J844_9PLEO|nr:hypothetical protein K458DRAFT_297696 [Lentithecium fluviatile CBS 122367]
MALATLYAKAAAADKTLPACHAFIIDHRVRDESTEEAEWVKQQLRWKFEIPATIIPLTWPEQDPFNSLHRFETDARKLRYQALGRACREHEISELLVAHHADDQAETILMRLMKGRWRSGLQGMQAVETIPECYGIHGVYRSGSIRIHPGLPIPVVSGGIKIMRPLLPFRKERLIATCKELGVAWAEDKSNQDQTLTARNAIRHVMQKHQLPAALSVESLVDLGERMRGRVDFHKNHVEKLLRNSEVLCKLDIQTSSLNVRFPPSSMLLDRPIWSKKDVNDARNTAYILLDRLAGLVTPLEYTSASKLSGVVSAIYPELEIHNENSIHGPNSGGSLCAQGLWWQQSNEAIPSIFPRLPSGMRHPMDWLLSRQPLERHELGSSGLRLEYPPRSAAVPLVSAASDELEQWQLFDRWWFQIQNLTRDCTVVLRFFTTDELRTLMAKDKKLNPQTDPLRNIKNALKRVEPASLCRHLPALFLVSPEGKDQLVALPTLGAKTIFPEEAATPDWPCTWDVRYKAIDSGDMPLQELILPEFHQKPIRSREGVIEVKFSPKAKSGLDRKAVKAVRVKGSNEWVLDEMREKYVSWKQRVEMEKRAILKRAEDRFGRKEGLGKTVGGRDMPKSGDKSRGETSAVGTMDEGEAEGLAFLEMESKQDRWDGKRGRR